MPYKSAATLVHLLDRGRPSSTAITVPDGPSLTYSELRKQVYGVTGQLDSMGLGRGDRVAIALPNRLETIVSFLAVSSLATAAPLNPAYKEDEFRFYMEDTGARVLITPTDGGEEARRAAPESTTQLTIDADDSGHVHLKEIEQKGSSRVTPYPDDVALVLHTSGTTSRPKRVPLSHRNLTVSVQNVADTYQLGFNDVSLCVMPLFHVHGLVASTLATLFTGGTIVLPPRFNALGFWKQVEDYGVTWYSAVPSMHQTLLNRAKSRSRSEIPPEGSGLRFIRSCSSALSPSTMVEMEEHFKAPVLEAYGMTEAAHQMASNPLPDGGKRVPGSVGPGTGVSVSIMDEEGNLLPEGSQGEVVIQGSNVIGGYEDNPEANASSFTNGWFRTGDEGIIDSDGYLRLVGRIKELINRSGEKIAPIEIDEVLLTHPAVAEAVAFAIPHDVHGEEPSAAVVLSGEATQAELVSHCREHLAAFKCPRTIHIVNEIPRTATGKVQRRLVAEAVAAGV